MRIKTWSLLYAGLKFPCILSCPIRTNASLGLVVHRIFLLFTLSPQKIKRDVAVTPFYNFFFNTYQIQCKEWGFLCRELFGPGLGTGDYGHLTVEHSPMLMRRFKSMARYSNQGFEAAHKVHRQLYAHCTNHDSKLLLHKITLPVNHLWLLK